AAIDRLAIEQYGAGSAVAHIAAGLGTGEADHVAQRIQKGLAWLQIQVVGDVVDSEVGALARDCARLRRGSWHPIRHDTLAFLGDDDVTYCGPWDCSTGWSGRANEAAGRCNPGRRGIVPADLSQVPLAHFRFLALFIRVRLLRPLEVDLWRSSE